MRSRIKPLTPAQKKLYSAVALIALIIVGSVGLDFVMGVNDSGNSVQAAQSQKPETNSSDSDVSSKRSSDTAGSTDISENPALLEPGESFKGGNLVVVNKTDEDLSLDFDRIAQLLSGTSAEGPDGGLVHGFQYCIVAVSAGGETGIGDTIPPSVYLVSDLDGWHYIRIYPDSEGTYRMSSFDDQESWESMMELEGIDVSSIDSSFVASVVSPNADSSTGGEGSAEEKAASETDSEER